MAADRGDDRITGAQSCPRCGGKALRVRRHVSDRLISFAVGVQRYRCDEVDCHWEGLLRVSQMRMKA